MLFQMVIFQRLSDLIFCKTKLFIKSCICYRKNLKIVQTCKNAFSRNSDKRRSSHWKLTAPAIVKCPNCGAFVMPHHACKTCGKYNGRDVIKVDD